MFSAILRSATRLAALGVLAGLAGSAFGQITISGYDAVNAFVWSGGEWALSVPSQSWRFAGNLGAAAIAPHVNTGTDPLGDYQEIAFGYFVAGSSRSGSIRLYATRPVALFSLTYNNESANTAPFPAISSYPSLHTLSFGGVFSLPDFHNLSADSPWVFFDDAANTWILSPASDYMTANSSRLSSGTITAGIAPQIATLAAGFTHRTALVFGQGINQTFGAWGQALTDLSGKARPANDADMLLKNISYWTDNGATYYYNPGGPSYTGTLDAIRTEFDAKGIRLGSMQLDSWWYPKGPDDNWSSHAGIWLYTAAPALFQPDLATFDAGLGTPLITHARWIDSASPYRTQYAMSGNVITDPRYWESIADYLQSSGVKVYEQDWLGTNAQSNVNLTDPYDFLGNMAASMAKRGINIQYCMGAPRHFLQSTVYNNVTTLRTSNDRFGPNRFTEFFYSSRFAAAVGAWPFTDVFMSEETNNLLVATLSGGPVGIGDGMGKISRSNLLKAIRTDGVIVKPDVPATPLDSAFIADAQGIDTPMVVSAWTDFGGGMRANYIFAYTRAANTTIMIDPTTYGISGASYLYDFFGGTGRLLGAGSTLTLDLTNGTGYFVLVPTGQSGMALLGDRGQFVMLGRQRIPALADDGTIDVTVSFAPGETHRTLIGFSPRPVSVVSLAGTHRKPSWDSSTQIFAIGLRPDPSGNAHIQIALAESAASAKSACRVHCSR
ncbi:MAG TPA: hypothetical protein VHB50_06565 [Bryobacteraceae bacterium]|nr:hypothetical protein [Bryobacteraceae bacterium]